MVPALMMIPPVKVFTPDKVKVETPVLVNVPVPLMIPETVALLVPPKMAEPDKVIAPDEVPVPLLLTNEPLITKGSADVYPFRSTNAPAEMVVVPEVTPNAPLTVVALETPHLMVPALTVVLPL